MVRFGNLDEHHSQGNCMGDPLESGCSNMPELLALQFSLENEVMLELDRSSARLSLALMLEPELFRSLGL